MKLVKCSLSITLCLLLSGCGIVTNPNPIIDALQVLALSSNAAVIAVPILQLSGAITPAEGALVVNVAQAASMAAQSSITEEESADTNPVKIQKIIGYLTAVPLSVTGLPPEAAALIAAISTGVYGIIQLLQMPNLARAANAAPTAAPPLTKYDRRRLREIGKTLQDTLDKVTVYRGTKL